MPANQKTIFALDHVSGLGNRLPYAPGEQVSGRLPDYAIESLKERGLVTDDAARAKRAAEGETERQAAVAEQIAKRSEKRGKSAEQ